MTFVALQAALDSNDDTAVDSALDAIRGDAATAVEAIDLVLTSLRRRGVLEHTLTSWHYRLAQALEDAAIAEQPGPAAASRFAVRAALLQRDILNDGEGTTRTLVLGLVLAVDDVAAMREAVDAAGGGEPAVALLEKAAKRAKGEDARIGRLRRALARVCEVALRDPERAFFEALKAARKLPADGLAVDEVYRLALETKRLEEAAAFFQSLADDEGMAARTRATASNKLGAVLEEKGDHLGAFSAYVGSLRLFETKAARRKAERLQEKLELATPLPPPVPVVESQPPAPAAVVAPAVPAVVAVAVPAVPAVVAAPARRPAPAPIDDGDTAALPVVAPSADTLMAAIRPPALPGDDLGDDDVDLDADGDQHILSEEAAGQPEPDSGFDVGPPPMNFSADDDGGLLAPASPRQGKEPEPEPESEDVDVDNEASLVVERFDLTVERPPDAATMTMQPPPDDDAVPSDEEASLHVLAPSFGEGAPPEDSFSFPRLVPSSAVDDGPLPAPTPVDASSSSARPLHAGFVVPAGAFDDDSWSGPRLAMPAPALSSPASLLSPESVSSSPSSMSELTPPPPSAASSMQSMEEPVLHVAPVAPPAMPAVDDDDHHEHHEHHDQDGPSFLAPPVILSPPKAPAAHGHSSHDDEASARKKAKKAKKHKRRGHEVHDAFETTTPSLSPPNSSALDATMPGGEHIDDSAQGSLGASADGPSWLPSPASSASSASSGSLDGPSWLPSSETSSPSLSSSSSSSSSEGPPDQLWPTGDVPSVPEARAPVSLGDVLPEPAITAPGGLAAGADDEHDDHADHGDRAARGADDDHDEHHDRDEQDDRAEHGADGDHNDADAADSDHGETDRDLRRNRREQGTAQPTQAPQPVQPVPPSPRDLVLARAVELLGPTATHSGADVADFLTCAEELAAVIPGDPRALRLAGKALLMSAPGGELPEAGCELVIADAARHGERAATIIRDIQQALPPARRIAYAPLWLAGAKAAGHDVDTTHALLEEVAATDGPDGPLFSLLDAVLRDAGDLDRRDVLHLRAWRTADKDKDEGRKVAILHRRIELLEAARRDGPAMQAWIQLTLEHSTDKATRSAARRFLEQKATPDERARFLARLARKLEGDEAVAVLRELLAVRVTVDDRVGAEATARDLLGRVPGDARAVTVLAELLADDPRRTAELVDVLLARVEGARRDADSAGAREALERLARAYTQLDRGADAAAALVDAARLAPGDAGLVQRVTDTLIGADRIQEAVDLLDELADDAPMAIAGRLWLRAAELARERLKRLGRARELLEKAVAADGKNVAALDAHAELLLELGDAKGALATLEKLAGIEPEGKARARVHLRLGRLLEEHLQRDDDALKRYRAALDGDRTLVPAWEALHGLARRLGDRAVVAEALMGLAGLQTGRARAQSLVKLGKVHEVERSDYLAAATAYEGALAADAADIDALTGLVGVRARILQGDSDVEAAMAVPSPELVDEVFPHLQDSEAAGATLPFALRRMLALGVTQLGKSDDARRRFESLLEERSDDLPTLLAFARHLGHTARQPISPGLAAAADDRRREVLEAVLLHHAYALKPAVHLDVWGEVCALRLQQGDLGGAKKAAKKALALLAAGDPRADLDSALSDRAVRACVLALEDGVAGTVDSADVEQLELALRLDLQRAIAPSEKARLKEKQARIAVTVRNDVVAARQLLAEALQHDPDLSSARESLFDLELSGEDPRVVLERSRALLGSERDSQKKALLHLKLFRLQRKLKTSSLADDAAAAEIKAAVDLDPKNVEILESAEKFFNDRKDAKGLDDLFTARLKSLDRGDVAGRTALLDRLGQLRRYELRDLRGAIDACEAHSALDPDAIKPREDAARLHVELGQWKEAVIAWRAVIDRDTLLVDAWRGLFSVLARSRQADEAFAVAASMVALEIADDDMVRAVRAVRPPFPRWPIPPSDLTTMKKKLSHPLERTSVRAILEVVAPRLLPRLGRPLEDFGVRRRDAIVEAKLPASVAMAVRTAGSLAGFRAAIPLYQAELGATDGDSPAFAALPAREPGLIVTGDVVRGGVTPERAFALGRAVAWLSPWALLAASLDAAEIRRLLESLVAAFLTQRDLERPSADLEAAGADLKRELLTGLGPTEQDALLQALLPPLRDWVVARSRTHLADWKAGVGYSGDRLGFLLAGDLPAAVKVIRSAGASTMAMRLAIKELVLFSISQPYLQLRRELSLALPEQALAPILDLG